MAVLLPHSKPRILHDARLFLSVPPRSSKKRRTQPATCAFHPRRTQSFSTSSRGLLQSPQALSKSPQLSHKTCELFGKSGELFIHRREATPRRRLLSFGRRLLPDKTAQLLKNLPSTAREEIESQLCIFTPMRPPFKEFSLPLLHDSKPTFGAATAAP